MAIDKKKIPEINAGSMADIAFLLLIFFLVATTMNVDTGLQRVLPPISEKQDQEVEVKKRNLLLVFVNTFDDIQVGGERMDITQVKDKAKEFILNAAKSPDLPETTDTEIDLIGSYPVSQGVISLQNDRGTSYNKYIMVQNELTRAFNEVRDEVATAKFGRSFAELGEKEREAITKAVPLKISEAEPKNIGGK